MRDFEAVLNELKLSRIHSSSGPGKFFYINFLQYLLLSISFPMPILNKKKVINKAFLRI